VSRQVILVVEDDPVMRNVLTVALRSHGYDVKAAANGRDALREIQLRTPDGIIMDVVLPDLDGFEIIKQIRRAHEVPIIVLSARGEERHQVRALDNGANDYVTKPFREGELMARIRAALRRPVALSERRELRVGDLYLDALQRRAYIGDTELQLTPTEFKLLHLLARECNRVITHQQLLREVWGVDRIDDVQYLRVYMRQLRQKLEKNPAQPERLLTALGVGYRLVAVESSR
jgi:two-component system KDP operon response regulator KdpE